MQETYQVIVDALENPYSDKAIRRLGGTTGEERGVGPNHEETKEIMKTIYSELRDIWDSTSLSVKQMHQLYKDTLEVKEDKTTTGRKRRTSTYKEAKNEILNKNQGKSLKDAMLGNTKALDNSTEKINDLKNDVNAATSELKQIKKDTSKNDKSTRNKGRKRTSKKDENLNYAKNDGSNGNVADKLEDVSAAEISNLPVIVLDAKGNPIIKEEKIAGMIDITNNREISRKHQARLYREEQKRLANEQYQEHIKELARNAVPRQTHITESTTVPYSKNNNLVDIIKKALGKADYSSMADYILRANVEEQKRIQAERISTFGLPREGRPTSTSDKTSINRVLDLFGNKRRKRSEALFQDVDLSEGFKNIDTGAISGELQKVLSGPEMFKAQTGGLLKNIIGPMTLYLGQQSLEKSKAQAEGLNSVLSETRQIALTILQDIKDREYKLEGLEASGEANFINGQITEDSSSEAKTLFKQMEEKKLELRGVLADIKAVDKAVADTDGKIKSVIKQIYFASPELMKQNVTLQNINAGLDKNGKALKFQTRTAEILEYTFKRIARQVGNTLKSWVLMLNPINWIKKAFKDFMSYDIKWQRTMNVIKYNIRTVLRPFMQWISQKLVNIIGFFDIILMKIQAAFGQEPVSLFDQSAADAEKMREELEKAANVTAGFDELHDIGVDSGDASNDLLGEIYKPELSDKWKKLAEDIGDLFAGVITGDMGFGEAMKKIFAILLDGLKIIWGYITDFWTQKIWPYIKDNWDNLLKTLLKIFLAWELLKIAGPLLWKAISGIFTTAAFTSLLKKIGSWLASAFTGSALAGTMLKGGTTLGQIFAVAFVSILATVLGHFIAKSGINDLIDNTNYNAGIDAAGGDEKDKKKNTWGNVKTVGGRALEGAGIGTAIGSIIPGVGTALGAVIGTAIGTIVGLIETKLRPAYENLAIAAREANNEMQKIEYYQGAVQGYSSKVSELDELMSIMNETLEHTTENVYKQGEGLGIEKTRIDELVNAVKDGTFTTDMLTASEQGLADSLLQLEFQQNKNKETSEKLTEAKKKLAKAEMDLAIAQDIEAGNFELATARLELALASEVYATDDAQKKITQIIKKASAEQRSEILQDLSPEMRRLFEEYASDTEKGYKDITSWYDKLKQSEKEAFLQDVSSEYRQKLQERTRITEEELERQKQIIRQKVNEANAILRTLDINKNGKILGISYIGHDIPGYAVGTNYVPNNGLAYLHQGEAVIPAKYNQPYEPYSGVSDDQISELVTAVRSMQQTMGQGISVHGEFVQRGSDLVATVEKASNRVSNNILSQKQYAR